METQKGGEANQKGVRCSKCSTGWRKSYNTLPSVLCHSIHHSKSSFDVIIIVDGSALGVDNVQTTMTKLRNR